MLKQLPILIEDNLDGTYFVLFSFNGKITKGNVSSNLVPIDYESLSVELTDYFQSWYDYLNQTINPTVKEEIKIKEKEKLFIEGLNKCTLLTCINNKYYRLNNTISLPEVLVQEYVVNQYDTEFISKLDNFWYWCSLNQHDQKEMLYNFLKVNKFEITKDGFIVGYRNVIKLNNQFTKNVEQSYITIKQRKKSPKNYFIDVNGNLVKTGANLNEVYNKNKMLYTHDRSTLESKRLIYEFGKESSLDRTEVDWSNASCSHGLHGGSMNFIEKQGQNYCGNTTVCILANPLMIASCPDNYNKFRAVAIYFCDKVEWVDGKIVPLSQEQIDIHSENYTNQFTQDLELFVNSKFDDINPKFVNLNQETIRQIINY